jgi:WXG100 family type VII secretion target
MQFTATPQELMNAAATCQNTNQQIQGQIQRIQAYILDLMGSYQGPAATQLQTISDTWARDASALNAVLDEIAHNLQINANNYSGSEQSNIANLGGAGAGQYPTARLEPTMPATPARPLKF